MARLSWTQREGAAQLVMTMRLHCLLEAEETRRSKSKPETGEVIGVFESIQPSDTDLVAKAPKEVKIQGIWCSIADCKSYGLEKLTILDHRGWSKVLLKLS